MPQRAGLLLLLVGWSGAAAALPKVGQTVTPLSVEAVGSQPRALPDPRLPVLIMYEDQTAQKQNQPARDLLGRITDRPENRGRFELMAVADVEKWNWWPARKFVLDDLRQVAKRENTAVYVDWHGALRRAWGLRRGLSTLLLVGTDGRVRFSSEGTLSPGQLQALAAALAALGAHDGPD